NQSQKHSPSTLELLLGERRKRCQRGSLHAPKRKRGSLLLVPGEREESKDQQSDSEEKEEADSLRQVKGSRAEEEEKKKKEDALWASFLSDVGQKSKAPAATTEEKSSSKFQEEAKEPEKSKDIAKVTITKVFDFAGEEVRAKRVPRSHLLQDRPKKENNRMPLAVTFSPQLKPLQVKRPSGMSSLLGKIGSKKQKMSTLEKSKLDWENFKEEEGIGEDLAIHNRGKEGAVWGWGSVPPSSQSKSKELR
uniref:Craniofacial development protein 1 n=1 Tax=Chelydra serpentina TaxID=8475 RepID=A0A8C3XSL6_CHESE